MGNNVENLTLTGTAVINGTGNSLNNVLIGNSLANTLTGGLGDDTYVISTGDVVVAAANAGNDTVVSDVTYTLAANVENLTLTGTAVINGTGNSLNNILTGNSLNITLDGGAGADTLSGGLGNDTYVVDNTADVVTEYLNDGTDTVQSSVTYTLGNNVENLTLTGTAAINGTGNTLDNILTGNSFATVLTGGAGNDTLNGGAGADTLIGGVGDDTYVVDNTADVVTENLNEGTDTVQSSVTYTLGNNVENLTLTGTAAINGTGNTLDNILTGNSLANVLTGGAGNDTLNGGAGAATLIGGLGDDTYVVDNTADVVSENLNEGTDTVDSFVTYTLGYNVENLTLTGTVAINGTGNSLNNVLIGNSLANTLTGGLGDDTYVISTGDVVVEAANAGTDTVVSDVTYTLAANVENLTLTGTAVINGTGNSLNNILTGNSLNNTLTGGAGADTLSGGLGNDTYVVDNTADVVTENLNEGFDSVDSSVTYTLGNNVENLTLTGTAAINGTGNSLNKIMTGNSPTNTLTGGLGDDTYVISTGDVVVEAANAGTATVVSDVTYTLAANVENLTLTGTAEINGTGNTLYNILTGLSRNYTLYGGAGADTLRGGLGYDTYVVDNTADVVTENLNEGTDTVQSSVTYTLGNNVENLTLTGTAAIN